MVPSVAVTMTYSNITIRHNNELLTANSTAITKKELVFNYTINLTLNPSLSK